MGRSITASPGRCRRWAVLVGAALCLAILAFLIAWRVAVSTRRTTNAARANETLRAAPVVFNFRNVSPAQRPIARFTVRNPSWHGVTIIRVVPSCSCISARCPVRALGAGKSTHVYATFDATLYSDYQGPFSKYVSVLYRSATGTSVRVLNLFIEGKLVDAAPLFAYPSTVDLNPLPAGSAARATIYLRGWKSAVGRLPSTILVLAGENRAIADRNRAVPGPQLDRRIAVQVTVPSAAAPGRFESRVLLPFPGFSPVMITIEGRIAASARGVDH